MALRKIICPTCDTVYKIDDQRIPDKPVVRSKCKKCGGVIVVYRKTAKTVASSSPANGTAKVKPPKPSAPTADRGIQKLSTALTELKNKILGHLYAIDAIEGWEKVAYNTLKALGVFLICKFIIFILALLLPAMVSNMIGLSLFVLILNWRTVLHLDSLSAWKSLLIKKSLVQLILPLILVNLYAVLSQVYDNDILPLVFGVLLIAVFIILPFYVNYHLAIEHEQNVPKIILLTVIGSWLVTLYLAFMLDEDEDEAQG